MERAGFPVSKKWKGFFFRWKNLDYNLYPYHVVLTMKAKDRRLRRGVKEKTELHCAKECVHVGFAT